MSKSAARKVKRAKASPAEQEGSEVEIVEVMDPFEPQKNLAVAKNVRVHPLDLMAARGRLTAAQKLNGDRFLAIYDRSQIGGAQAIDYSRTKVDVSFSYGGLDPSIMEATDKLKAICQIVGRRAYTLLVQLIGHRKGVFDLARGLDGTVDQALAKHLSASLKDALDDLDDYFGVARGQRKQDRSTIRRRDDAAVG